MSGTGVGYAWINHKHDKEEKNDQVLHWYLDQAKNIQELIGEEVSAFHIVICGNGEEETRRTEQE
jgi:hypothetical protein